MMKEIKRIFYPKLEKSIKKNIITLLTGIRQSGKTTALRYLEKKIEGKRLWINFDKFQTQARLMENPENLVSDIEGVAGKVLKNLGNERIFVFLDEVQKVPQIFGTIKWLYDHFKENIKFFLSGSSSLNLYQRISESLAGRTEIIKVFPFTFKEALHFISGEENGRSKWTDYLFERQLDDRQFSSWCDAAAPFKSLFEREFDRLMLFGTLPGIFHLETENDKWEYLSNFRQTYIEKDVRNVLNIGNLVSFNKMLSILSNRTGNLLDYSNLAVGLKLNRKTVARYMNILQETFIIFELLPFFKNLEKRVIKTPKVYFSDSGLRNQVSGSFSLEMIADRGEEGKVFEQVIITEIKKLMNYSNHPFNIYFYRTHAGAEIDLVLETAKGIILIEAKRGKKGDIKNIRSFMEAWQGKKVIAFILTPSEPPGIMGDNIFKITPWMLLS